ncbi:MAG TPA: hypothetical protein VFV50_01845 [Bdellovibrionales bacterium]|nr:hypothetical protein [Bdellovibrionales bacterium]
MTRGRAAFIRLILLLFILEASYVAAGNYFIRSDMLVDILNKNTNKTFIGYEEAWTLLPGLAHVKGFTLRNQDKNVQWRFTIERATVSINLLWLPFRRLNITKLNAEGVRFHLRTQKAIEAEKPGLPDIPGFTGDIPEPSKTDPSKRFRFVINNITISQLSEIWVEDYRFNGRAEAAGSFYVWPKREFDVKGAEIRFIDGQVLVLGQPVAETLKGSIKTVIGMFPTETKKGPEVLDYVGGSINLSGRLGRADFLNVYLSKLDWVRFDEVAGSFAADMKVENGVFSHPSLFALEAENVETKLAGLKARGSGRLIWKRTGADDPAIMTLDLGRYEFIDTETAHLVMTGTGLQLRVTSGVAQLRNIWNDVHLALELPPTEVHELTYFNKFIPAYSQIAIESGKASIKGTLYVNNRGAAAPGLFQVLANDAVVSVGPNRLRGDITLNGRVKDSGEGDEIYELSETELALEKVLVAGDDTDYVTARFPWSGRVLIEEGRLNLKSDEIFSGKASLALLDLRPLLEVYSVRNRMAPWVRSLLRMRNVKAEANLAIGRKRTSLTNLNLVSQGLDLKGWYQTSENQRAGAILADLGLMNVGLDVQNQETRVVFSNANEWFEGRKAPPEN